MPYEFVPRSVDPKGWVYVPDPLTSETVAYAGHFDHPGPPPLPDIGDHVSATAPDPTPDEVTDPDDPDWVAPWTDDEDD